MIQRIQTIFLLLCGGGFGALFGLPFATSANATSQFLADKIFNVQDHILLLILTGLGILLSIGSIFLFKNRALQLRMSYFLIILSILVPLCAMGLFYGEAKEMMNTGAIEDGIGIYVPIASLIFAVLASRFIKKDDNLVKSMDRLR